MTTMGISNTPVAAYGLRQLVSGYTGPVVQIAKAYGGPAYEATDIYLDANGVVNTVVLADWAAHDNDGASCVVKWYDQSGNGNDATPSNGGCFLTNNGKIQTLYGKPTVSPNGNARYYATLAGNPIANSAFTITSTFSHPFGDTNGNYLILNFDNGSGDGVSMGFATSGYSLNNYQHLHLFQTNNYVFNQETGNTIISPDTLHIATWTSSGLDHGTGDIAITMNLDLQSETMTLGGLGGSYIGNTIIFDSFQGSLSEWVIWNTELSSTDRVTVEQNVTTYLGEIPNRVRTSGASMEVLASNLPAALVTTVNMEVLAKSPPRQNLTEAEIGFAGHDLTAFTAVQWVYSTLTPPNLGNGTVANASTANATLTVPSGMGTLFIDWLIAGGGAGGVGSQGGYGGGGAGGGSGGYYEGAVIPVNQGDTVDIYIGNGGVQTLTQSGNAPSGEDSWVTVNGIEVIRATGGQGGGAAATRSGVGFAAPGGLGGEPFGDDGSAGDFGGNDHSSWFGSPGAAGPLDGSFGGVGGDETGGSDQYNQANGVGSPGGPGIGYGSAGGGSGTKDRTSPGVWAGGIGAPGYALVHFLPAQTQSGPATANTTHVINLIDTGGFVDFYTDSFSTSTTRFTPSDPLFGSLQNIGVIGEATATASPRISVTINPPSMTGIAFISDPYQQGAQCRIWTGIVDSVTGRIVIQPELIFQGFVDTVQTTFDAGALTCQMDIGSVFELLFAASEGQRLNNAWHQSIWPNETGLKYVIEATAPTNWGTAGTPPAYQQFPLSPTVGDRIAGNQSGGLTSGATPYG
jgi:hypothetical protein